MFLPFYVYPTVSKYFETGKPFRAMRMCMQMVLRRPPGRVRNGKIDKTHGWKFYDDNNIYNII